MCPHSNVQTGAATSIAEHPIGLLTRLRFRVTVNTDNRLMSQTSMSKEMTALVDAFGYTLEDLRWFTINAMKSAFLPFDERLAIIDDVIKPGYAELGRSELSAVHDAVRRRGVYERPSMPPMIASTGSPATVGRGCSRMASGHEPSVTQAKKTPPSLGADLAELSCPSP